MCLDSDWTKQAFRSPMGLHRHAGFQWGISVSDGLPIRLFVYKNGGDKFPPAFFPFFGFPYPLFHNISRHSHLRCHMYECIYVKKKYCRKKVSLALY